MIARRVSRGLVVALAIAMTSCGDDAGGGEGGDDVSSTSACDGCRTVAIGNELQDGGTSVGVLTCDATSCAVSVAEADGSEADLDLAAGDGLDVGAGWVVVATGADGLTLRPA